MKPQFSQRNPIKLTQLTVLLLSTDFNQVKNKNLLFYKDNLLLLRDNNFFLV